MTTRERELQATLVRLSVLCASSLKAVLGGHVGPAITDEEQDGQALAEKIYNDAVVILRAVQKDTTALSLAMRPEKGKQVSDDSPPTSCIDDASIESATKLLQGLATDHVPKLVFLANLAHKNRAVYKSVKGDEADEAARKFGTVLNAKHGERVPGASVGTLFASEVKQAIGQIVDQTAQLCQSFMDPKTRAVLDNASRKRGDEPSSAPPPSRAYSLSLTKLLWSTCDSLIGTPDSRPPLEKRLPRNNQEAFAKLCKGNEEVLADATSEMKDALESDSDSDEQDEWADNVELSDEEKELVKRAITLLESGTALARAVRAALLQRDVKADFDEAGDALVALVEAQDNVAAIALYGDEAGDESLADIVDEYTVACKRLAESSGTYRTEVISSAFTAVSDAASQVSAII
ncbi:kynureninase [Malassezia cuniculi]|uniref:Kynureninase n=1 Tax=Malassezia cuniculi TaxID=948313 RepID=A0AAF0F1T8_9BASI|nr:kynureninase [Malassezia cuniculi]